MLIVKIKQHSTSCYGYQKIPVSGKWSNGLNGLFEELPGKIKWDHTMGSVPLLSHLKLAYYWKKLKLG